MTRQKTCRRPLVLVTLVCFTAACQHWVALDPPVAETLAEHRGKVRLTLEGGQRVEFGAVRVARDSVFALTDGDTTAIAPMSDVVTADERKDNLGATIGLAFGIVAGSLVLICIAAKCGQTTVESVP